jgi:hypothetical protein
MVLLPLVRLQLLCEQDFQMCCYGFNPVSIVPDKPGLRL